MTSRRKQAGLEQLGPYVMGARQIGASLPTEMFTYPMAMLPAAKPMAAVARDVASRNAGLIKNLAAGQAQSATRYAKTVPPALQALVRAMGPRALSLIKRIGRFK